MFKETFIILVFLAAVRSNNAATFPAFPNEITGKEGSSIMLTTTVSDLTNSTLTWHISSNEAATAIITVIGNKTTVGEVKNLHADAVATFTVSGSDVMTNLTLNSLNMTLNESMIKISDGTTESNAAFLIVAAATTTTVADSETTTPMDTSPTTLAETETITPMNTSSTTSEATTKETTAESTTRKKGCDSPLDGTADCLDINCTAAYERNTTLVPGKAQTCKGTYKCSENENWEATSEVCTFICVEPGTWGDNCTNACGRGCALYDNKTRYCDVTNGRCLNSMGQIQSKCEDGYRGENCEEPICQDCNGGICLSANFCGNCPMHYEHGVTCRNIRLEGFLKGSLPSLGVLAVVVILLSLTSRWHINRKIKEG